MYSYLKKATYAKHGINVLKMRMQSVSTVAKVNTNTNSYEKSCALGSQSQQQYQLLGEELRTGCVQNLFTSVGRCSRGLSEFWHKM